MRRPSTQSLKYPKISTAKVIQLKDKPPQQKAKERQLLQQRLLKKLPKRSNNQMPNLEPKPLAWVAVAGLGRLGATASW